MYSYSSIPSYNLPGETPNIMTFLDRTTSEGIRNNNKEGQASSIIVKLLQLVESYLVGSTAASHYQIMIRMDISFKIYQYLTYIQAIKKVLVYGSPKRLLSDRAPAFTSEKFRRFLVAHGIQPLNTTSKLRLLHLENPKTSWTKLVNKVTQVYNNTPHSVTGFPPSYLLFGIIPTELSNHINPYPPIDIARQQAYQRTQLKHDKDKQKFDLNHKTPNFEIGDLVLVKVYHHPNTGKLTPYFTGPYTILEVISPNVVKINRPNQPLNKEHDTIHVNKLRPYTESVPHIAPPTMQAHLFNPKTMTHFRSDISHRTCSKNTNSRSNHPAANLFHL
ncbi:hypothetical protein LAZ67_21001135 [Cordylochernes scorpioides]|uniref:Tf2-1-like SH3-like domain-containing protein n=1 Tax=Cordylochernes scorpioides TaxID=51811 RepID=A0ABY6LM48_9ARAC|nr:hypothetical protein LAZ67_21001135 [Cordylochernes scorpioides]